MSSLFRYIAAFHDINTVGINHIHETVGNKNNCLALCQSVNLTHDVVFAFHIYIGSGFIKDINRAVVEQSSCQRQTLTLTAGKVAALLGKLCVETGFALEKSG